MNAYLSPLIILLAFAFYSALHSWLASLRVKSWAERAMGSDWVARYYRAAFNAVGVLTLLPILWLAAVLPNRELYAVPYPWRWLSYAGQALGLWILWASLRLTGAADFLGLRQLMGGIDEAPGLTTSGVYARMRHPLYTGAMLVLWLMPDMSLNLAALILAFSLYFWIGAIFEERKLVRYFGREYEEYRARTPMFLPRLFE